MKLTAKEKKAYIESDQSNCPKCGSWDIEGSSVEIDSSGAWQPVSCNECEAEWTDIYSLTSVEMKS